MGNKKNRARKNKKLANNWRNIIKTRKSNKAKKQDISDSNIAVETKYPDVDIKDENFSKIPDPGADIKDENFSKIPDPGVDIKVENFINSRRKTEIENAVDSHPLVVCPDSSLENTQSNSENDGHVRYILQKIELDQTQIIRGSFHQGDERFSEFSRNKQSLAVSVVALCFFQINGDPCTWKPTDVDLIVVYGDAQYNASYKKMKRERIVPRTNHLLLSDVYPYIKFGREFYYLNEFDANHSNLESNALTINNLMESLNLYFTKNQHQTAIFTYNDCSFAIVRNNDSYFIFNSYATACTGEPIDSNSKDSAACLAQIFTIKCLAKYIYKACSSKHIVYNDSGVEQLVFYLLVNVIIERKVFGKNVTARQKVTRDLCTAEAKKVQFRQKRKNSTNGYSCPDPKRYCVRNEEINEIKNVQVDHQCQVPIHTIVATNTQPQVSIGCGLKNIGNSCFFNACVQALLHIPAVNMHLQITKQSCTCVLCELFRETHSQNISFDPTCLYETFRQKGNTDILNGRQQDAQEFWIRLMKLIESDAISCTKFSNWFDHKIDVAVTCENCNFHSIRKEDISAHVIEIRGKETIQEALNAYFEEQTVSYKCDRCDSSSNATKTYFLKESPKHLCLFLNRFENTSSKIVQSIMINQHLQLSRHSSQKEKSKVDYRLVSVINHIGGSLDAGHYTSIACNNKIIYEFDDIHVRRINAINNCDAYMLIYESTTKIDEQSPIFVTENFSTKKTNQTSTVDSSIVQEKSQNVDEILPVDGESLHSFIGSAQYQQVEMLNGRRIVDIGYFFKQMKTLHKHSEKCDSEMQLIKETKLGLRSIFKFACNNCDVLYNVESCAKDDVRMCPNISDEWMHVNEAATLGITATGLGFYHLEEFCANLDIPCMSAKTFTKEDKKLQKLWWILAKRVAAEALQKEIELAKTCGSVDSKGNALIQAEVDGSWAKRSYGKGYSSLSGFASIIGIRTKKVVYFDVKNKYCHVCKLSYARMCPPNKHECNINYEGPSTGMEATIIVEGFQACEKLGARFHQYVGDGDASTYKELREAGIYKDPEIDIDKLECGNHLDRNARSKIDDLSEDKDFKPESRKYIPWNLGDSICKGVRSAAKHWREANVDDIQKLENLERDCLNAPYHYFGCHTKCPDYFCKKSTTSESLEIIELLKADGLFYALLNICNIYFASNAKSLLAGLNNNDSEALNNLIAKNTAGKRVNYVLAGSYKSRCGTAVVQWNCKGRAESTFQKFRNKNSGKLCYEMETRRIRKCARNAAARADKPRKKISKTPKSNQSYGSSSGKPDISERSLEAAKKVELARLDEHRNNRDAILKQTHGQRYNTKWHTLRKKLVNSSYFHRIVNAQSPKSYPNILNEMMYSPADLSKSAETRHQRAYEREALDYFSRTHKDHQLEKTGLFIDKDISFLGASPSRLYGPESAVLVKCPVKCFNKSIDEAISKNLLPFWKHKNGNVSINQRGNWYIEMQGMLHVTDKKNGFLVVWLGDTEVKVEEVVRDDVFWEKQMKDKLTFFYNEAMIKEVVNSRNRRKMSLRQYDSQLNAFI